MDTLTKLSRAMFLPTNCDYTWLKKENTDIQLTIIYSAG